MIYGYDAKTVNEYGLKEMKEVSILATPDSLRDLAAFLLLAAEEMEQASSDNWHSHAPAALNQELGCEIVVCPASEN